MLGVGDVVKITVYQNPDLSVEARVSETGQINFPLIGAVTIGGLSVSQAQALIEKLLRDGGFVLKPQVTIQTVQIRSSQISILGQVAKPGRFPIEIVGSKVSEMIAAAGGVVPGGADVVTLVGNRDGKPIKLDIDLPLILQAGPRRPRRDGRERRHHLRRPGAELLHVRRSAAAGPAAPRAQHDADAGARAGRRPDGARHRARHPGPPQGRHAGAVKILELKMNDPVERDDVIYVRESIF